MHHESCIVRYYHGADSVTYPSTLTLRLRSGWRDVTVSFIPFFMVSLSASLKINSVEPWAFQLPFVSVQIEGWYYKRPRRKNLPRQAGINRIGIESFRWVYKSEEWPGNRRILRISDKNQKISLGVISLIPQCSRWSLWQISLRCLKVERETGLEPATFSLARRRSTNWAIPALGEFKDSQMSMCCQERPLNHSLPFR